MGKNVDLIEKSLSPLIKEGEILYIYKPPDKLDDWRNYAKKMSEAGSLLKLPPFLKNNLATKKSDRIYFTKENLIVIQEVYRDFLAIDNKEMIKMVYGFSKNKMNGEIYGSMNEILKRIDRSIYNRRIYVNISFSETTPEWFKLNLYYHGVYSNKDELELILKNALAIKRIIQEKLQKELT